jgi:DNA-binding NarL/FixJ family response regulator
VSDTFEVNAAHSPLEPTYDPSEPVVRGGGNGLHVVTFPGNWTLTAHELRVLELMADGCDERDIARKLSALDGSFVSPESVKSMEQRVVSKLRARSRPNAVAIGLRSGLIQ